MLTINTVNFPLVMTNGNPNTCHFCGSRWGVSPELDCRFGHTEKQARAYGWFYCCGWCYAHVLNGAYSNLPEMKPRDYQGYRPQGRGDREE